MSGKENIVESSDGSLSDIAKATGKLLTELNDTLKENGETLFED